MDTKIAPSLANIFIGNLKDRILSSVPYKSVLVPFIDDIDFKLNETADYRQDFLDFCNNYHLSIKFTSEVSIDKTAFLDTTMTLI